MTTQTVESPAGRCTAQPGSEPHPDQEGSTVTYPIATCPRFCSPWRCVSYDGVTQHRSSPRTIHTDTGPVDVAWVRVDEFDIPGDLRLDVQPTVVREPVAA